MSLKAGKYLSTPPQPGVYTTSGALESDDFQNLALDLDAFIFQSTKKFPGDHQVHNFQILTSQQMSLMRM
jgi:hypothetical protein